VTHPFRWRGTGPRPASALVLALVAVLGAVAASHAVAELTQRGNLFVRFDGGIQPKALPRDRLAPIAVRIEGTIRAPTTDDPPALHRIRIALNRAGSLDTRGLPTCTMGKLRSASTNEALAACSSALVGSGGVTARISIPEQTPILTRAEMLLFNSVVGNRPAIIAHVFQRDPAPITRVVVFRIRHVRGAFGTVLEAAVPPSVNRTAHIKTIYLQLERHFVYRGRQRSYLSAGCAAPPGFTMVTFPFAQAAVTFEDGRTLSSTLVRTCRVR
jgi:hypothetical protein